MKKLIVLVVVSFFSCNNKEEIKFKETFVSLSDYRSDYEEKFAYQDSLAASLLPLRDLKIKQKFFLYMSNGEKLIMTTLSKEKIILKQHGCLLNTNKIFLFSFGDNHQLFAAGPQYGILEKPLISFKEIK